MWGAVELQEATPEKACGRGSGMGELVRSWRLAVFRGSEALGCPSCPLGGEWSWDQ